VISIGVIHLGAEPKRLISHQLSGQFYRIWSSAGVRKDSWGLPIPCAAVPSAIVRGHRANVSRGLTAAHDPVELSPERGLFTAIAADDNDSDGDTARSRYERSKSEQALCVTMSDPRTVGGGNRNLFQKRACLGH
jgi:hypothetical protein